MSTPIDETTVLPPDTEVPTQRADLPAIWDGYRAQLEKLKATAETLVVTAVDQKAEMKLARVTRLTLKDLRVEIEKRRKELGEDALRTKQKIDKDAKALAEAIEPLETRLMEQERFAEIQDAKRKEDLRVAREEQWRAVTDLPCGPLGEMTEDQFVSLLAGVKAAKEAQEAAAKKAEEERIAKAKAEAEERERIRLENERLKEEAAKKEAELAAEREKFAKEKAAAEEKARAEAAAAAEVARKEREAIEAKAAEERKKAAEAARIAADKAKAEREAAEAKAAEERQKAAKELAAAQRERDRIEAEKAKELAIERAKAEAARKAAAEKARIEREVAEQAAREERAAREKIQAELDAKREAEEEKKKADALAAKKAAADPDKQKIESFAAIVRGLSAPECATAEGKAISAQIAEQIMKFADWTKKQADQLA